MMTRPRNQAEQELKARARIYVANIPQAGMSRKEVVSVFHKYGEIDSKLSAVCIAVAFVKIIRFFKDVLYKILTNKYSNSVFILFQYCVFLDFV
jgi:hypothetical protein